MSTDEHIRTFFAFARERHRIYLRRTAGMPWPWTDDPVLRKHRFTNVYRELDKTTKWFKDHIREPMRNSCDIMLATVIFRWFNRITTGEALFLQEKLGDGISAFEEYLLTRDISVLRCAIKNFCGSGPYVTGAFIINTPTGMSKLDGVLWGIEQFEQHSEWKDQWDLWATTGWTTLELAWRYFRQFPRLGDFMSYEIVTDLRHTALCENAEDILTWANPGPGAKRGLSYIYGGGRFVVPDIVKSRGGQIRLMQELLGLARTESELWPGKLSADKSPPWEMREVEHTLCEYAKYEMVKRGEGRTKGAFR